MLILVVFFSNVNATKNWVHHRVEGRKIYCMVEIQFPALVCLEIVRI